jgi:hypothetical protein
MQSLHPQLRQKGWQLVPAATMLMQEQLCEEWLQKNQSSIISLIEGDNARSTSWKRSRQRR